MFLFWTFRACKYKMVLKEAGVTGHLIYDSFSTWSSFHPYRTPYC